MQDQEQELLEGYRQLKPESRRFIMSLVSAVTAESAVKRQFGLPAENSREGAGARIYDKKVNLAEVKA